MNKARIILAFGIILLCVVMKFNSMAMNSKNLSDAEIILLNDQLKKLDAEILNKEQELEHASKFEEFALAKELNALRKKQAELKKNERLDPSLQKILLQMSPVRESIPAGKCLNKRVKKLVTALQESNKNNVIVFPLQYPSIYSIEWSHDGTNLITCSTTTTSASRQDYPDDRTKIIKIWNTDGTRVGPDLKTIPMSSDSTFYKNSYIQSSYNNDIYVQNPHHNTLAFLSNANTIKIWDMADRWENTLQLDSDINTIDWSPDGTKLAIRYETGVKIWDIDKKTKTPLNELSTWSVAWSPDSTKLATLSLTPKAYDDGIDDAEITIWDTTTRTIITKLPVPTGESVSSISWSPNGTHLAGIITSSSKLLIWEPSSGKVLYSSYDNLGIERIVWSPNGNKFTTSYSFDLRRRRAAKIFNTSTGKQVGQELYNDQIIFSRPLSWSPDGSKILSTMNDIKIWDADTGKKLWNNILPNNPNSGFKAAAWSPDGTKLATTSDIDGTKIWDVATQTEILSNKNLGGNHLMAWSPNSRKLILGNPYMPKIWDMESFFHLQEFMENLNIDQCDMLQALEMMLARAELGKPLTPIEFTEAQWHTFVSFPEAFQNALRVYIKRPAPSFKPNNSAAVEQ